MPSFQQEKIITMYTKKQESMAHSKEQNKLTEITLEEAQIWALLEKTKTTILSTLKEFKKNMDKN